jgi:hypothetical protein
MHECSAQFAANDLGFSGLQHPGADDDGRLGPAEKISPCKETMVAVTGHREISDYFSGRTLIRRMKASVYVCNAME